MLDGLCSVKVGGFNSWKEGVVQFVWIPLKLKGKEQITGKSKELGRHLDWYENQKGFFIVRLINLISKDHHTHMFDYTWMVRQCRKYIEYSTELWWQPCIYGMHAVQFNKACTKLASPAIYSWHTHNSSWLLCLDLFFQNNCKNHNKRPSEVFSLIDNITWS